MISWDNAQTIIQNFTSDFTSDSSTFQNLMANVGYKYILAELGRPVTEKTMTAVTVASQQFYQFAQDYLFLKSVTITVGGVPYPLTEEESQENWDLINASTQQTSDIPVKFFLRPSFGVGGAEIGFWPTPASAGNTITAIYEATDKDLSQTAYTTGTITLTNASAAVVGSGTTFTVNMVGRYLNVTANTGDGLWYKIASFTDATHITLENVYGGVNVSGVAYQICEIFALPEEMQILPCYFSAMHYWGMKTDKTEHDKYQTLFERGLALGMRRHATKSRGSLTRGSKFISRWKIWAPMNFPSSVSS